MLETPNEISKNAVELIRTRLNERTRDQLGEASRPTQAIPELSVIPSVTRDVADLIGVGVECLRMNDRFSDILCVNRAELPEDIQPLIRKFNLGDRIAPFALDLLDFLEKRVGRDQSKLGRPPFVPLPRNEDEWVDRIMGMTVGEFVTALAGA